MNISTNTGTWLNRFKVEITSSSNRLYGNGRQQIEVTVVVAPALGKNVTTEQLNSITLVTLDDDGVYRELQGQLTVSSTRNPMFDYFAATGGAPANLELNGTAKRKRFYVSSTRVGGSLTRIYARISKDANTHYVTDAGSFHSAITIETLAPLRLEESDFSLSVKREFTSDDVQIDLYSLRFKAPQLRIVASVMHDAFGDGGYHYRSAYRSEVDTYTEDYIHYYNTHYAFSVGPPVEFDVAGQTVRINQVPGQMNFVRTSTTESSPRRATDDWETSLWGLLDQYGNEHKIEVTDEDNGHKIGFERFY